MTKKGLEGVYGRSSTIASYQTIQNIDNIHNSIFLPISYYLNISVLRSKKYIVLSEYTNITMQKLHCIIWIYRCIFIHFMYIVLSEYMNVYLCIECIIIHLVYIVLFEYMNIIISKLYCIIWIFRYKKDCEIFNVKSLTSKSYYLNI